MSSREDPFAHPPAFIGRLRLRERLALSVCFPVGIIAFARLVALTFAPGMSEVERGLLSLGALCCLALLAAFVPSFLGLADASAGHAMHGTGALLLHAGFVGVVAAAELGATRLLGPQYEELTSSSGGAGVALFLGLFALSLSLLVVVPSGRKTFALSGVRCAAFMMVAAVPVSLLFTAGALTSLCVSALAFVVAAVVVTRGLRRADRTVRLHR